MAITTVQHPIDVQARAITAGLDGALWFVGGGEIGAVNPSTGFVGEVKLPNTGLLNGIGAGKDGKLYVTDELTGGGAIGVFDPKTFAYVEYPTPTKDGDPSGIAVAPDGTIWFTEPAASRIASFDPTTHAITEYPTAAANSGPSGIVVGPDGGIWFTEVGAGGIGRFDPTTHAFTTDDVSTTSSGIIVGPDGKLWFGTPGHVDAIDPTSHAVQSYPSGLSGSPGALATGPDGHVYYSGALDILTQAIGDIDPTTHATRVSVTPGPAFTDSFGVIVPEYATGIVAGPDGQLWFSDANYIGAGTIIPPTQAAIAGNVSTSFNAPAAGQLLFLDVKGTGLLAPGDPTAVADASGYYTFTGLAPGTYTVRVAFAGNLQTMPAGNPPVTASAGTQGFAQGLQILSGGAILPLSYSPAPFGSNNPDLATAEVNGLYNTILGRAPDPTGQANAVAYLKGGGSTQSLALGLMGSAEYQGLVVAEDYRNFAGRDGTAAEVAVWVNLMQQGTSAEQIAYLMLTSDGFNSLHPDDASFVQALYNDLLGRRASGEEVAAWVTYLSGTASRASVVHDFVFGAPAMTRAVDGFASLFWAAPLDPATEQYDVAFLVGGQLTLADVASAFAGSPQFARRAAATVA